MRQSQTLIKTDYGPSSLVHGTIAVIKHIEDHPMGVTYTMIVVKAMLIVNVFEKCDQFV